MEDVSYRFSGAFHRFVFLSESGVEPLLVADHEPSDSPQRIFLLRYVMSGAEEYKRPIFKEELTGYDYEAGLTLPTRSVSLDSLLATVEPWLYGLTQTHFLRSVVEGFSTRERKPIKVVVSEKLVEKLASLYGFGEPTGQSGAHMQ